MQWQDWVFSVRGFIIAVSLIPTLKGKDKPALTTCIITSILIWVFAATMASLSLWLSALANATVATEWSILTLQKYHQSKS